MQLNLNTKEWLVLLAHLERTAHLYAEEDAGVINRVRSRLRSVMESALQDHELTLGDQWITLQERQIKALEEGNDKVLKQTIAVARQAKILTADDNDDHDAQTYPRRAPRLPGPGKKGRKRR